MVEGVTESEFFKDIGFLFSLFFSDSNEWGLCHISLQHKVVDHRYFKLQTLLDKII